jgi:acyl transferase domain-containing protein
MANQPGPDDTTCPQTNPDCAPVAFVTTQASADDKFADYKPTTAFFFPGQGAQSVGMAKVQLAEAPTWLQACRGLRS